MPKLGSSTFLKSYADDAVAVLSRIQPKWDCDEIEKIVVNEMKKSFSNPDVTIDNNYTGQTQDSKLLTIIDWYIDKNPILAGNGTFFKQHAESINPTADMLDWFLSTRNRIKDEMFSVEDEVSLEYISKDLLQSIWKVNANSYYGGSGMPSSAFYNKYCAASTTSTAQSVISTCYSTFEAFLADNFAFYDINECFDWLKTVISQIEKDINTVPWLKKHSASDVYDKLCNMFLEWKSEYSEPLFNYLKSLDENTLSRIYYRNDIRAFTCDHDEVKFLHRNIMNGVKLFPVLSKKKSKENTWENYIHPDLRGKFPSAQKYNTMASTESFMNPNNPPESISDDLKELSALYLKYVYTQYMAFDRIHRLKNFKRKAVVIIDTDSNIIALDQYVEFVRSFIGHVDMREENEEFIIVNTIAYILTDVITDTLLYYGECSNISEEYRPIYNMKNEYFMKKLIIATVKKRYMSLFKLREGNLLNPPVTDIKGFDFMKSSTSDVCEQKFRDIIEKYMLNTESIDVIAIRQELRNMEIEIMSSIKSGNLEYLPNGSPKELAAYVDPGSEQSIRGSLTWNFIYPETPIEFPSKVKMLKLMLFREEDIEPLKLIYPEIYRTILDKIFYDKSGIFVSESVTNGKIKRKSRGMQVLAIPTNQKIPDWVKPFIDYNSMISSILAPFKSVTDLLKINCVTTGFSINSVSRKNENFTNIINF